MSGQRTEGVSAAMSDDAMSVPPIFEERNSNHNDMLHAVRMAASEYKDLGARPLWQTILPKNLKPEDVDEFLKLTLQLLISRGWRDLYSRTTFLYYASIYLIDFAWCGVVTMLDRRIDWAEIHPSTLSEILKCMTPHYVSSDRLICSILPRMPSSALNFVDEHGDTPLAFLFRDRWWWTDTIAALLARISAPLVLNPEYELVFRSSGWARANSYESIISTCRRHAVGRAWHQENRLELRKMLNTARCKQARLALEGVKSAMPDNWVSDLNTVIVGYLYPWLL